MKERISKTTPKEIIELFNFPYEVFSEMLGDKNKKSVLDAGCGEGLQEPLLLKHFKKVCMVDKDKKHSKAEQQDLLNLSFKPKTFDVVFCFEVIEHLEEQEKLIKKLKSIAKEYVVFGSVNKDGPDFYKGVEIFKAKNNKNPFHLKEMGILDFIHLFRIKNQYEYYRSVLVGDKLILQKNLGQDGLVNYIVIKI